MGAHGLKYDDSHGFSSSGWKAARATKSSLFKGTLFTVGGAVGGSVAGAALGLALGGNGSAAVGSLWGQLAGGVIGLGTYGAMRAIKADKNSKHPLALTRADKRFLLGMVGGAIAGGGVGTALGSFGGKALGELVGGALAGPMGASVGSTVLGWTGALACAYGGAKLGAAAGSGRLFGRPLAEGDELRAEDLASPQRIRELIEEQQKAP
jgi:hypothetical protein